MKKWFLSVDITRFLRDIILARPNNSVLIRYVNLK